MFMVVQPESFQPEELCSMNFGIQNKFYKHLKKMCAVFISTNTLLFQEGRMQ